MIYENISKTQFSLVDLKKEIAGFIVSLNCEECGKVDDAIDEFFKANPADLAVENSELHQELKILQQECQWIGLKYLNQGKIINCFRNINIAWQIPNKYEFSIIEDSPYDWQLEIINKNLEKYLRTIYDLEKRDQFKNLLMEVLRENTEIITKNRIVIGNENLKSTLTNWFNEYFSEVGTGSINKLRMAKFFSENKNYQKLAMDEKMKLKIIFSLYERIKLTSFSPQGNEDRVSFHDQRGIGYIYHGEIVRYSERELEETYRKLSRIEDMMIKNNLKTKKDFPLEKLKTVQDDKKNNQVNNIKPMISDIPFYKPTSQPSGLKHDVYGSEDEKEIEQHRYSGLKKDKSLDVNAILVEVKEKMDLLFSEPEMEMRFNNLCSSYLKGIRDEMELAGMLAQPTASGGLDYKTDMAEKITNYLKKLRPQMPAKKHVTPLPKVPVMPTYTQAQNIMKKSVTAAPAQPIKMPTPMPQKPVVQPPKPTYMPQLKRMESAKPVIQDIRMPAKDVRLIGPIEELGSFTLVKFRRLADTPVEAAEKIKEKVDLLEEQSIPAKAKGIVAFKNSPLNRIYLKIGNASIDQGRSVAEIISELSQKGEDYLTKEEFDCIADLNKKLRF